MSAARRQTREKIPDADFNSLVGRFKQVLGERVTDVRASNRLSQSVARLVDPDGTLNRYVTMKPRFENYELENMLTETGTQFGLRRDAFQICILWRLLQELEGPAAAETLDKLAALTQSVAKRCRLLLEVLEAVRREK